MPGILLVIAGGLEVIWAHGLSEHHGYSSLLPSLITIVVLLGGFALLGWALRPIRRGTVAGLCTLLGTAAIFLPGAFWLSRGMSPFQIVLITLITGGIMGLQLVAHSGQHASDDR